MARATIFSSVRGIVHDPQHRPVGGAKIALKAVPAKWSATTETNVEGAFLLDAVPLGDYVVTISAAGFQDVEMALHVSSGNAPILHFALSLATLRESVQVQERAAAVDLESSAEPTTVTRAEIAQTPGADQTNSLAMITDFVPGAYVVHDQLHLRGGHQMTWQVDGVPVPNTNIASNVGPQFDPKDVDYLEVERGGYSAEYGDRTYGVFNVVPRSGFERNNQAELVASYGNFHTTNDQLSLGSHTERFAYYASVNANRSDLGLLAPVSEPIHDMEDGQGGFGSLIFNATPDDQLRLVASVRGDHYQIPNDPNAQAQGIRDLDIERDAFANFSWIHTLRPGVLLTLSPFYHFNRANYIGGPNDPFVLDDDRTSQYGGGQATLAVVAGKHNAGAGLEAFAQHDTTLFALQATDASALRQQLTPWGNQEAAFLQEQYKLTSWLSLNGGIRLTHYEGLLSENAANPRLGAAVRVPKLGWTLHGYYGRYYQAPPLDTVSGPLLQFALQQGVGFLPLRGERDEEYEAGLSIPFRNWSIETDVFRSHARNFFDHDEIGNSNIFLPLTVQGARIQGWEATARSPEIFHRARIRLAYSHQFAQGFGAVTGGLTDFSPPAEGFFFLDHDQRNTLSSVISFRLPLRAWASTNISYGSGFLNGDGPAHLPAHTAADLELGKSLGESWSVRAYALNVGNRRFLLDNSNTFGGTHFFNPRQAGVEVRYQFHY